MTWRCRECGRTYDEPPESCPCGVMDLEPDDGDRRSRFSLLAARRRLLEPGQADRSLTTEDPRIEFVFRLVILALGLGVALLVVRLLV